MCACRVECSSLSSSPGLTELETYMSDRLTDGQEEYGAGCGEYEEADIQAVLEQKDSDLRLAAELGKALLERNAELERRNEQLAEEYTAKIEEVEQERHGLHLKLQNLEDEYETTVKELQYDINSLRRDLDHQQQSGQAENRERAEAVRELSQQNERLTEDLQMSARREAELEEELKYLRDLGLTGQNSLAGNVEALEQEVSGLVERQRRLEREVASLTEERESLLCCLEEAQDRIQGLERHKHDQEQQIYSKNVETRELQETVSQLTTQLDHLTERSSNSSGQSQTLFNELSEISGLNSELAMAVESPTPFRMGLFIDDDDDYIECDDNDYLMISDPSPALCGNVGEDLQMAMGNTLHQNQLEAEVSGAYEHLRDVCDELRSRLTSQESQSDDASGGCDPVPSTCPAGLVPIIGELRELLTDVFNRYGESPSHVSEICALQERIGLLESDLRQCQEGIQRLQEQIHQKDVQLQERSDKMTELSNVVTGQQEDMRKLSVERDRLQDLVLGDVTTDDVIQQARADRDQAISRKAVLEQELLQARLDVMTLHGQLMDAIQQKATVSKQLDQWQVEIEELLGLQLYQRGGKEGAAPGKEGSDLEVSGREEEGAGPDREEKTDEAKGTIHKSKSMSNVTALQ